MKVVQINAVYGTGSTGRIAMELHRALKGMGEESYVFTSDGRCGDDGVFPLGTRIDHKMHALLSRLSGKQGYFSAGATTALLKQMDTLAPDIVHLHNLHGNYIHLPMLLDYLGKKNIATVVTLHDCWFFTGKCTHYTKQGCFKWETGCHDCPKLKSDNASWFFDRTKTLWEDKRRLFQAIPRLGVIGVSDWITGEAERSFLKTAKVIRRIYNWIDLDMFQPGNRDDARAKLGLEHKFVILGVASGWSEQKGLKRFLQLAEQLDEGEQILLVGKMPDVVLPKNVTHVPPTHSAGELAELYRAADVFLQLSKEETFGKVAAEALACGIPVITNRHTANPELVKQSTGMVAGDDLTELRSAVAEIKAAGREAYTKACRRFAETHFDKEQLVRQTLQCYQDVLNT